MPSSVRDAYLWAAVLAVLLTFPLFAAYAGIWHLVAPLVEELAGRRVTPPLELGFVVSGMTAVLPPLLIGASRTSTFILECVRWYLDHGEEDKAKGLARALDYQVWYREWKRNPWFRRFAAESGLVEESARFAKFARRLPPG